MRRIIAGALAVLAAVCIGIFAVHVIRQKLAEKRYGELREEVAVASETPEVIVPKPAYTLEEVEAVVFTGEREGEETPIPEGVLRDAEDNPVDFDRLKAYNKEIYAWIRIPGTRVDYPVAQHAGSDREYYLHRDFYGNPQFTGCIYSEHPSALDFSDPVTIFYGHNMADGSMFGSLRNYLDTGFFEENRYLYFYTPERRLIYEIYAAYVYDDRYIPDSFDFSKKEELEAYLESTLHPRYLQAQVREGIAVTGNEPVVTLSTCVGGDTGNRLLVQAVRVYESD